MSAVTGFDPNRNTGPFALAASPARYDVERGDWSAAAELKVRPSKFAYVEAITYFARALGAARSGNPQPAKVDIAKLAELRDRLREAKDNYWADQVDVQRQAASAWVLHAEGSHVEALKTMMAAADAEDKTEKGTVTPGPHAPARELALAPCFDSRRQRGRRPCRVRSDAAKGAQPARRHLRRGESGGDGRRHGESAELLREGCRADPRFDQQPRGSRGCAQRHRPPLRSRQARRATRSHAAPLGRGRRHHAAVAGARLPTPHCGIAPASHRALRASAAARTAR